MSHSPEVAKERRELLYSQMAREYEQKFPQSAAFHRQAQTRLIDGGSHALRMFQPFPAWIKQARGANVYDLDGHAILDFWQGHYTNVLGHNPAIINDRLADDLREGHGLQLGQQDVWEWELANILCQRLGAERVRFTTSGSLSTMYAIMLSRAFTGRNLVLKIGGGWHGSQPWGLKAVSYGLQGFADTESEGLPAVLPQEILVTSYNDCTALEEIFKRYGDQIACFIVEPFLGVGGFIPATAEFLRLARDLTTRHGSLLISDEVIACFRFRAGNLAAMYGIQPDLTTMGKIMGGGMPVAAVAGRAEVMSLCGNASGRRVKFDGGTYAAHPLSMRAGRLIVEYLTQNEHTVYGSLGELGARAREIIRTAFANEGVLVQVGADPAGPLHGSSIFALRFPFEKDVDLSSAENINNPAVCDMDMRERVVKLAFLLEGVFIEHGSGSLSTAHTDADLGRFQTACNAVAHRLKTAGCALA